METGIPAFSLIGLIKFAFGEDTLQKLRQSYRQQRLAVISHELLVIGKNTNDK